jgi:hypothetical protein
MSPRLVDGHPRDTRDEKVNPVVRDPGMHEKQRKLARVKSIGLVRETSGKARD